MKNLTAFLKNSISTLCLLFVLCSTSDAQLLHNFTRVQQNEGLILQRIHDGGGVADPTIGTGMLNFNSDDHLAGMDRFEYIYMRATATDDGNNVVITNDGTVMIGAEDNCENLRDMKEDVDDTSNADYSDIKLYVNGGIAATTGNGTITILSDQRFKKNIIPLKNSLDVIRQSNFVEFEYNDLSGVASNKKYYGILAQEMQKILPSTIKKGSRRVRPEDTKGTEFLMFNPNDLIYSGLNAIKELDEENQVLKDRVAELETEVEKNKTLEQRVSELEKMLAQLTEGEGLGEQNTSTRTISDAASSHLYQNQPNPSRNSTDIEYYLSSDLSNAKIVIQDLNGNKITEFNIQGTGIGKVTFNARQFGITSGTYIYSLLANETVITSQKMIFIE